MFNTQRIFKAIYLFIFPVELLLLIITCVFYFRTSDRILSQMNKQKTVLAIINRDLNKEYLSEKMLLLLDDMILVMRAYEKLIEWKDNKIMKDLQAYDIESCIIPAKIITTHAEDNKKYLNPWWINKAEFNLRYRGIWFTFNHTDDFDRYAVDNSDMIRIAHCCFLKNILTEIFEKHYNWKNKIYVTLDFLYFTFQSGTFFKFPAYQQKPPTITDCGRGLLSTKAQYYDPRCRPYYKQAEDAYTTRITITQPYKFISGAYGNDICIKSKEFKARQTDADLNAWNMNQYLFCAAFNFFDYYLLKTQIDSILKKTETVLYLIYFNHVENSIKVLFNSQYYPNDLSCVIIPNFTCEAIDLYNVYYKKLLDEIKALNLPNEEYISLYKQLKNDFDKAILKPLINILKSNNEDLLSITINNHTEDMIAKFSFTTSRNMELVKKNLVSNINKDNVFYVFPLMGGFDIKGDDYEIVEDNSVYNYYIITNERGNSFHANAGNFKYIIAIEVFLFLFYLMALNGLIWIAFSLVSYFVMQGFTSPLGMIAKLYIEVGQKMDSNDKDYNSNELKDSGISADHINRKKTKTNGAKTSSFFEKLMNLDEIIIARLVKLFRSDQYDEVKESLTTLKAFNLIIDTKNKSKHDNTNNNFKENINSIALISNHNQLSPIDITYFFQAILFLYNCFYYDLLGKHCDHKILCLLLNNIFTNLLDDYHNISPEEQRLNNSHINLFYEKKIMKVLQIAKKQIKDDNASKKFSMEYALKALDIIAEVEENIVYRYSIHNAIILDERILLQEYDKHKFNPFDDEHEENAKLRSIERIEKMQGKQKEKEREKEKRKIDDWIKNDEEKEKGNTLESYNNELNVDEIDNLIRNINIYLELHSKHSVVKQMQPKNYDHPQSSGEDSIDSEGNEAEDENKQLIDYNKSLKAIINTFDSKHSGIIRDFYEILEELTTLVILSKYYLIKNNKSKGLNLAKEAFNKLSEFEKLIISHKNQSISVKQTKHNSNNNSITINDNINTINEVNWSKTNFILLTLNIFFYEKIFFSFGLFYESHHQLKSALFVYTNILDLGPFYSISIRRMILIKLLNLLKKYQTNLLLPINSISAFKDHINEQEYINQNLIRIKLATILNVASMGIYKQVTFLFDFNNKFVKNKLIKSIIQRFKDKQIKQNKRIILNFCGFDYVFYLVNDYNASEKFKGEKMLISPEVKERKSQCSTITQGLSFYNNNEISENKEDNGWDSDEGDMLNEVALETFFHFFDNKENKVKGMFQKESSHNVVDKGQEKHKADYALHNTIIHSFKNWSSIVKPENTHKTILSPSTLNNYLIMMINLDADFNEKRSEMKDLGKLLFNKKITLIIIITYDESMERFTSKKHKIEVYKNFLRNYVNDGHLFIMRSLSMLKFIFNTVFPIPFSEFNADLLYHYIKNVDQIKHNNRNTTTKE